MEVSVTDPSFMGSIAVGLAGVGVWLRKQRVGLAKDNSDIAIQESNVQAQTAVSDVIELMREEVKRLNDVNTHLSQQIVHFQAQNIAQSGELSILKQQNSQLTVDIIELKAQLVELKHLLSRFGDCSACKSKLEGAYA